LTFFVPDDGIRSVRTDRAAALGRGDSRIATEKEPPVRPHRSRSIVFLTPAVAALCVFGAACSSGGSAATPPTGGVPSATGTAPQSTGSGPSSAPGGAGAVPASCNAIPQSLITPYTGSSPRVLSLKASNGAVSCEFSNANASTIIVLNLGHGSQSAYEILRAGSASGGRTVQAVSGLGSEAFSVSKLGKTAGLVTLTNQDVLVSLTTNLTLAQDEQLTRSLIAIY
jgi:hypothetical protein